MKSLRPWTGSALVVGTMLIAAACVESSPEPDPRQLLVEMREALRAVEGVRYQMSFRGTGYQALEHAALTGSVELRRLDLSGGRYLARLDARVERPDGSSDRVIGVRSEDEVVLVRESDRLARRSSIYEAGSSLLAWMDPTFLYVLYDPESLRDEIEADRVAWEGASEVAGEPCELVRVGWSDDEEEARWCIGDDRLPRRLEWIEGAGSTVLEAFELEIDPPASAESFAATIPAGYTVEELSYGPEPGTAAPADSMRTVAGEAIALADLAGSVLVLDFWATWCPPCLASLSGLERLAERFADRPVRFLAVNAQEDASADPVAFFRQRRLSSELLLEGEAAHDFYVRGSLPGSAVLDAQGRLVGVSIGYHGEGSERRLGALIERALEAGAAP
jgi:thiol-disulfide isomerase/thioredoxin